MQQALDRDMSGAAMQGAVPAAGAADTVNLLDYVEVVAKHKGLICGMTAIVTLLAVVLTLLQPNIYSATAMILPPQQGAGGLGALLGDLPGGMSSMAGDLLGKSTPSALYATMLTSDAMSDIIIDRYKLMDVYQQQFRLDTYRALSKRVAVSVGKKDGVVSICVFDEDPRRAAQMANSYVQEVDKLSLKLDTTDAQNDGSFLEGRLASAKAELAKAEDDLRAFQSAHKTVDITEQAKGAIKGVGDLEGNLAVEEVKLAGVRRVFADGSQEVKNQQTVVSNLRAQIAKFEGRRSGRTIPGVQSVPELGEQQMRLMRNLKVKETLFEFLTKQYEMRRLSASRQVAGVQVIQMARVPDKKAKPHRALIVMGSACGGAVFALLLAYLLELREKLSDRDRERLRYIGGMLLPGTRR